MGDTVLIEESRPLSRTKRWRLVEVTSRAGEDRPSGDRGRGGATTEAIHAAAHPGRAHAEPGEEAGRVIQQQTRLRVADNTGPA